MCPKIGIFFGVEKYTLPIVDNAKQWHKYFHFYQKGEKKEKGDIAQCRRASKAPV